MIFGALAEGFGLLMIVPIATIAIHGGIGRCPLRSVDRELDRRPTFMAALGLFVGGDGDSLSPVVRARCPARPPAGGL